LNPNEKVRQIVLDTETTGLEAAAGHRIIEIGCVELVNRRHTGRHFHYYLQPDRAIDEEAVAVHGITSEFLADKPRFNEIVDSLLAFIRDAELIIHNASFDVGFLDHELKRAAAGCTVVDCCRVLDSLELARRLHPGQRNSLDALCKRYSIDNSDRTLHGALLDAEILADVYLAMTREQVALALDHASEQSQIRQENSEQHSAGISTDRAALRIIAADTAECAAHDQYLAALDKAGGGDCIWRRLDQTA